MPCLPHARRLLACSLFLLGVLLAAMPAQAQKFSGLAQSPPMGWNTWNTFACEIDERLLREMADAMVATGMREAGYQYLNLDDCWQGERDREGFIQPDPARFPSGMKALADYVHGKGLRFGLYTDAGALTCGKRAGSQGHEYQDALQYAGWGVDYVKVDWCNTGEGRDQRNPREAYVTIRDALHAAGRPMVLSICEWGDSKPWEWAAEVGHLWRTSGDIAACWACEVGHGNWSTVGILLMLDRQESLRRFAGPGHWNDPDLMEVGNLPSPGENRAHFGLWAMLAAPLIAGADLRHLDPEVRRILTNRDIIAVDQDRLGIQGFVALRDRELQIFAKPLEGGDWAIAFLNRGDVALRIDHDWKKSPLRDDQNDRSAYFPDDTFAIRNLWTGEKAGTTATPLVATIGARDLLMFRLTPVPAAVGRKAP